MIKTITGNYSSSGQIKNALEDLIASGIPSEKLYADDELKQLKVLAHSEIEAEIVEILNRHDPVGVDIYDTDT